MNKTKSRLTDIGNRLMVTSGKQVRAQTGRGLRGTNYSVQNKLQGYITQHEEYSYFIITVNGV